MQIIKSLCILLYLFARLFPVHKQLIFPKDQKNISLLTGLKLNRGKIPILIFQLLKPYSRKSHRAGSRISWTVHALGIPIPLPGRISNKNGPVLILHKIDEYNLHSILMNNSEWVTGSKESFLSKKPVLKSFLCH